MTEESELIVIDGGSKDGTCAILAEYKNVIAHTISEPDQGIYDAWNKGIERASGVWIMFIGADDILLPNAISTYLEFIHQNKLNNFDYICANNQYVDENGKKLKIVGERITWEAMRRGMVAAHGGSLHNKEHLFSKVGLYDVSLRICADYEMLLRKKNTLKSAFIPALMVQTESGGISFSIKAIQEAYVIRKRHKTVWNVTNIFLFVRDVIAFKTFKLRRRGTFSRFFPHRMF